MTKLQFIRLSLLKTLVRQNGIMKNWQKKISLLQLDLELDDEEAPKLESGIVEMEQKLEEQKKIINGFIDAQANYDSKLLSSNLDYLLKRHGLRITDEFKDLLAKGFEQNQKTQHKYAASEELSLLNRLTKYQDNHLLFLYNENVKFHNNDSERDIRKCKTHQKMSGGFRKESGCKLYCDIMSIIETCKKKGMEVYENIGSIFAGKRAIF